MPRSQEEALQQQQQAQQQEEQRQVMLQQILAPDARERSTPSPPLVAHMVPDLSRRRLVMSVGNLQCRASRSLNRRRHGKLKTCFLEWHRRGKYVRSKRTLAFAGQRRPCEIPRWHRVDEEQLIAMLEQINEKTEKKTSITVGAAHNANLRSCFFRMYEMHCAHAPFAA